MVGRGDHLRGAALALLRLDVERREPDREDVQRLASILLPGVVPRRGDANSDDPLDVVVEVVADGRALVDRPDGGEDRFTDRTSP